MNKLSLDEYQTKYTLPEIDEKGNVPSKLCSLFISNKEIVEISSAGVFWKIHFDFCKSSINSNYGNIVKVSTTRSKKK